MKTLTHLFLSTINQIEPISWSKYIELGVVGLCLFLTLYYIFRHHLPKIMDQQTESNLLFKESLDKITERHERGMNAIADSLKDVSSDLVNVRETVATCRLHSGERKVG